MKPNMLRSELYRSHKQKQGGSKKKRAPKTEIHSFATFIKLMDQLRTYISNVDDTGDAILSLRSSEDWTKPNAPEEMEKLLDKLYYHYHSYLVYEATLKNLLLTKQVTQPIGLEHLSTIRPNELPQFKSYEENLKILKMVQLVAPFELKADNWMTRFLLLNPYFTAPIIEKIWKTLPREEQTSWAMFAKVQLPSLTQDSSPLTHHGNMDAFNFYSHVWLRMNLLKQDAKLEPHQWLFTDFFIPYSEEMIYTHQFPDVYYKFSSISRWLEPPYDVSDPYPEPRKIFKLNLLGDLNLATPIQKKEVIESMLDTFYQVYAKDFNKFTLKQYRDMDLYLVVEPRRYKGKIAGVSFK